MNTNKRPWYLRWYMVLVFPWVFVAFSIIGLIDKSKRRTDIRLYTVLAWILASVSIIALIGMAGSTTKTPTSPVAAPATEPVAAETTPSSAPKPPGIGDTIRVGSGEQQIDVKLLAAFKVRWVPFLGSLGATEPGVKLSGGWRIFVVVLRFKNTGSSFYHSRVANWSWLDVKNNYASHIEAMGTEWDFDYQDLQGDGDALEDIGVMQLDPGHAKRWLVAFKVRAVAKPVSFTYQGPGGHKVTWVF